MFIDEGEQYSDLEGTWRGEFAGIASVSVSSIMPPIGIQRWGRWISCDQRVWTEEDNYLCRVSKSEAAASMVATLFRA